MSPTDTIKPERRSHLRWLVRAVFLVSAIGALWSGIEDAMIVVPALSPLIAAASLLATWTFHAMAWLGWSVVLIALVRHRWFCRWMCPMGLCADGAGWMGRRLGRRSQRVGSLGQWIALITLGGACLGYPVFLWLDPLAMFTGLFRFGAPDPGPAAWCSAGAVLALLFLSLIWPNVWCGQFCPLGAFQELLSSVKKFFRLAHRRNDTSRIPPGWGRRLARRTVLGALVGAVWASAVRWTRAEASRPLRPPGSVDEPVFSGLCIRCGNCSRACPTRIIETDFGQAGLASLLTPVLRFRNGYCLEDCVACTDVCPSGALARVSLKDKPRVRIGLPRVDMNVCLLGDDRECAECRNRCPYGAIRYVFSEAEYTLTPRIDPGRCNGCGACEVACPTIPEKAIVVVSA